MIEEEKVVQAQQEDQPQQNQDQPVRLNLRDVTHLKDEENSSSSVESGQGEEEVKHAQRDQEVAPINQIDILKQLCLQRCGLSMISEKDESQECDQSHQIAISYEGIRDGNSLVGNRYSGIQILEMLNGYREVSHESKNLRENATALHIKPRRFQTSSKKLQYGVPQRRRNTPMYSQNARKGVFSSEPAQAKIVFASLQNNN